MAWTRRLPLIGRRRKRPASPRPRPAILAFEKQWWQYPGTKEKTIREMFGVSPTRYYQLLNEIIDKPAAFVVDPLLVRRLRRLRASRQRARSARRFGIEL